MRDPKPKPVLDIKPEDLAWAAGLLEGEGSFTIRRGRTSAQVQCGMTDEDVILSLKDRLGIGGVTGPYERPPNKTNWRWGVFGQNEIMALLPLLRPWMGERRRGQIDAVIAHLEAHHRPEPEHGTARMYGRGCRCRPCTTANTEYTREYETRRRASSSK